MRRRNPVNAFRPKVLAKAFTHGSEAEKRAFAPIYGPSNKPEMGPALDESNQTGHPLEFNHDRNMVTSER